MTFHQFDQVKLQTARNVSYYSSGVGVTPDGVWTVVAAVGQDLLLNRADALIRIPARDVIKVAEYDLEAMLRGAADGRRRSGRQAGQEEEGAAAQEP